MLVNNTVVLDCNRIAPAEQWVLEGDVKIEVGLQYCPRDAKQGLRTNACVVPSWLFCVWRLVFLLSTSLPSRPTQTVTHESHTSVTLSVPCIQHWRPASVAGVLLTGCTSSA